ncbi:MAG: MFS transporter [Acidimicrobiales bacterium]
MPKRFGVIAEVFASSMRNRSLRRVELGYGLFIGAEWAVWISLLVFAYGHGGTSASTLIAVVQLVPSALLGPVLGALADRFRPGRVLLAGYLAQALTMGGIALAMGTGAPTWVTFVLAPLLCISISVSRPAQAALLPSIVRTPDELTASNVMTGWVEQVSKLVVPAVAGVLLAVRGPSLAVTVTAVMTLVAGLLVTSVPGRPGGTAEQGVAGTLQGNVSRAWRHGPTRVLLSFDFFYQVFVGALDLLAVVLAISVLGLGRGGAGYLNAVVAAGGLAAGVVTAMLVGRRHLSPFLVSGVLGATFALALVAARPDVVGAFLLLAVVGFSGSVFEVTAMTMLQRVAPSDALAGIFSLRESLMDAGLGTGIVIVQIGVSVGGYRGALVIPAVLASLLVATTWRSLRSVDASAQVPQVEIRLLRSIPIFRVLPAPALEGLARELEAVSAPAGTVVIKAGDVGDRYYAIADGALHVERDGRRVATLGPGDGFGEIALVHDIPRLATVTADTDALLYGLDKQPFVLALTGHPAAAHEARIVTSAHGVSGADPDPEAPPPNAPRHEHADGHAAGDSDEPTPV